MPTKIEYIVELRTKAYDVGKRSRTRTDVIYMKDHIIHALFLFT